MTKIPDGLIKEPLAGLELVRRGKVRDTYTLPDPSKLLVVASDRISIFDFVLNALVPQKGAVLTAMNRFWRTEVMREQFAHDLVASGSAIDAHLPEALQGNQMLQMRATVVRKLLMLPVEAIARGCLTGSGLAAYKKTGEVCGHKPPEGLQDGDRLESPLFTPTTKAEVGHDEHISAESVREQHGDVVENLTLRLFEKARAFAQDRGIVLADTKFEYGFDDDGQLTVGDEVLTPDSSRFWDGRQWAAAQAKARRESPTSYDKQFVRIWGKTRGIDKKKPESDYDVGWVHGQIVPPEVLVQTARLYRYIFWRLTGRKLEAYQKEAMGIDVALPKPHVVVITGSDSDLPPMMLGLEMLRDEQAAGKITAERHIVSCHRHPEELAQIARELPDHAVVIAGAGMAAQLPGVLKAHLVKLGKAHIPVIGIACESSGNEAANQAAVLSMEQLPGQPVVLHSNGRAYFGGQGFFAACRAAMEHEFPPTTFGSKPAQLNAPLVPPA
ncbi:phosphoribosylaminoimidazolesuccinocarboxamide synthase [Patescibacteria group bacterium]|nr:MAG: phosphoribosylaminoimidazolesuccinocarboxamide synthase [Patescibacteria group bacterium]